MGSADYKNNIMRDTTIIISELELDGETAIKIANCIKKHEPEIWKGLSKALKQALPISDVEGRSEQLVCGCGNPNLTWYGYDDDKTYFCFECKKEVKK